MISTYKAAPVTLTVSKMELFSAMATGKMITLHDHALRVTVTGLITGIMLESGFTPPASPHNFNVTMNVKSCVKCDVIGSCREVYVKTID